MWFTIQIFQKKKSLTKSSSVRPNTEYSAEYSAKTRRIFGTEYSAKSADTPITENRVKMAVFDPFLLEFWSKFWHTFFSKFIHYSGLISTFYYAQNIFMVLFTLY